MVEVPPTVNLKKADALLLSRSCAVILIAIFLDEKGLVSHPLGVPLKCHAPSCSCEKLSQFGNGVSSV